VRFEILDRWENRIAAGSGAEFAFPVDAIHVPHDNEAIAFAKHGTGQVVRVILCHASPLV
jgi:hypothetical protein